MKKIILALFILIYKLSFAQSGWVLQNPVPSPMSFSDCSIPNENTIYTISAFGGTFVKTTNSGLNWTVKNILPMNDSVLYQSQSMYSDLNNIFILYKRHAAPSYEHINFIMKSTNSGETWDSFFVASRLDGNYFTKIVFANQLTGYCFTGVYPGDGVYRTTNAGVNWSQYKVNGVQDTLCSAFFLNENTGWIEGPRDKYYKTTNAGSSWSENILTVNTPFRYPYFINENTGWFRGELGFTKTTNGGANFFVTGTTPQGSTVGFGFSDANTGWCISFYDIFVTTNAGTNWIKTYENDEGVYISSIKFLNAHTGIAVGSNGGILKTTNRGFNWTDITKTVNNHSGIAKVNFVNQNTGWILSNGKLLKSTDGGSQWKKIDSTSNYTGMKFIDGNTGICISDNFFVHTTNSGQSFIAHTYSGYSFKSAFMPSQNTWYVFGYNGAFEDIILKTTDAGLNWVSINRPEKHTDYIYFVNETTGFSLGWFYISKTTNSGTNWIHTSLSPGADLIYFYNSSTGWRVNDENIYKTTDNGTNWQLQFSKPNYQHFSITFTNALTGWVTSQTINGGRLLKTTNGGINWFNDISYYTPSIYDVSFINENTGWVVGNGSLILKTTTGGTIGIQQISTTVPDKFYLEQNYPNPFNPATVISFQLPAAGFVKLKIFDLLGREVANLVNENLSAGSYKYDFNASALTSGIYFYKLETQNFSETRKMVLVK